MESFTKVDSKGRVLIPAFIRKRMKIGTGAELVMSMGAGESHVTAIPLAGGGTAECRMALSNAPGRLSGVMELLDSLNVGVVMSQSRNLTGNGTSEWSFLLDVSNLRGEPSLLQEKLSVLDGVKSLNVEYKN